MNSFIVCCVFVSTIFYSTKNIVNANNEFDHIKPSSSSYKLFFSETFDEADPFESGKWIKSKDHKYIDQPILIKPSSTAPNGFETDNGLFLSQEMKHYGFSSKFPSILNNKGKDLVVQYEVKFEEGLKCGGAYVKLPRSTSDLDLSLMNSDTPYAVMFGPDRCGGDNKVHFIIQHQNPVTGEWSEKHLKDAPPMINEKDETHLYTLVIRHDNSFEILIDKESVTKGNLLTHMYPEINPPKEINDPNDVKPDDWVDDAEIDDPNAKKPDDWDEDAPKMIVDTQAIKPEGWDENASDEIPDPKAKKPADWDDEEDGIYIAPTIPNPYCEEFGCGKWKPPMIKNPNYVGKFKSPRIKNPSFIKVWEPSTIPNPDYFYDANPSNLAPIAGIAVEVWTTDAGIHFDNFVVTDSLEDAFKFVKYTFDPKHMAETKLKDSLTKIKIEKRREEMLKSGGYKELFEVRLSQFLDWCTENPEKLGLSCLALFITSLIYIFSSSNDDKKLNDPKLEEVQQEDKQENE